MTQQAFTPPASQQATLRDDALLHRNVLESMGEGVLTVTGDGRIGMLNPAGSRLLGLEDVDVQGQTIADAFLNREGLEEFNDAVLAAVYDEAIGSRSSVGLRLADGSERSVAVTTSYLVSHDDAETRRIGVVAVLEDVTEVEALAAATRAQNAELRDAYREIEAKNEALNAALKKMTAVRALAMLLVVVLFGGAAWYAWHEAGAAFPQAAASGMASETLTFTVSPRRLVSTLSFVGRLAPRREVRVTSRSAGKVAQVFFEYGGRVTAGQPLVELDTAEARHRYREARAAFLEARDKLRELENWESSQEIARRRQTVALAGMELEARERRLAETALLLEQGVIPAFEHEDAKQRHDVQQVRHEAARRDLEVAQGKADADALGIARLRLENAETRMLQLQNALAEGVIRAPIAGVVLQPGGDAGQRSAEDGERRPLAAGRLVGEGAYLLSIGDLDGLSVAGAVDEVDVVKVKSGQPVHISGDAFPDLVFEGRIERISPQSSSGGGARVPTFDVVASIDRLSEAQQGLLRLGMSANVTVVVREEPAALLVPVAAVQGGAGGYRVRMPGEGGGAPREVPVQVGETTLYEVEILAGLKAGDEVIVSGP